MSQKAYSHRLSYRIAQETQLLAEEKWLVDALAKIKKQRNCLQIERLHLESLRAKAQTNSHESTDTSAIALKEPQLTKSTNIPQSRPFSTRNSIEFEDPIVIADTACNHEELNLAVSKSIFGQVNQNYSMEEYDEDEDDCDNIVIDMNMLMNGKIGKAECDDREK